MTACRVCNVLFDSDESEAANPDDFCSQECEDECDPPDDTLVPYGEIYVRIQ